MKECNRCFTDKPLSEFYSNGTLKDGHRNDCIDCCKERQKQYDRKSAIECAVINLDKMRKDALENLV